MAQIIKIKGSKTNASATPSSLVERELAGNLVDRCLFGSDGTSVFKYYTGTTKYFDANGYANNANKLGGQSIDYFASADGVSTALEEIIDSLKGYHPLITSSNKLAASLVSGLASVATSGMYSDLLGLPTTISGYGITDAYTKSQVDSALGGYLPLSGGTIGANSSNPTNLVINSNHAIETAFQVSNNNVVKSVFGWWNGTGSYGTYIYNAASQKYLGIKDDGTPHYHGNTLIHEGNYTDFTYSKSTIDTKLGGYLPLSGGTIDSGSNAIPLLLVSSSSNKETAIQISHNGAIKGVVGWYEPFGTYIYNTANNYYLGVKEDGTPHYSRLNGDSHTIIHSGNIGSQSVASAAKLTTARSIWGQSFDGTSDVSGHAMGLGGAIDFQFTDEINRYGGNLYLQHRGDGSQTGTGSGATGNVVMCYRGGKVGIGTNNPQYELDVDGTLHASGAVSFNSTLYAVGAVSFDSILSVGGTALINGNAAIGGNSDGNRLYVYGVVRSAAYNAIGNNNAAFVFDKPGTNYTGIGANGVADTIYFGACNTSGAWITDYYQKWHFNGEVYAKTGVWSDGYVSAKGQNTSSDMRLKNVLNEVVLCVKDIANAPSMRFSWKNGGDIDVGSSAQYWQGLLPDAVKERNGMLEMQYANIALLSAIAIAKKVEKHEEKIAIMETHEERIARLERENEELRNEINSLRYGA